MTTHNNYPGGSKGNVNRVGAAIRNGNVTNEQLHCLDEWRSAHRGVLNTFQSILRNRTFNKPIVVAQRHKRRTTIFDKLFRFPEMDLSRMDDIAGCRLIFNSIDELYEFRSQLHLARFKHKIKNNIDKYDYIKRPKVTGYRGVHDVYSYDVNSYVNKHLQGLYVEIQYRTRIQHAWSTAVEVIGQITAHQPKFQKGDTRYLTAMSLASEILARAFESRRSCHPYLLDRQLVSQFSALDAEINILSMLNALNTADKTSLTGFKNSIFIFAPDGSLTTEDFELATEAVQVLFDLEKKYADQNYDIVLVRGDTEEVREAFKNYFSDAREFLRLVQDGLTYLSS